MLNSSKCTPTLEFELKSNIRIKCIAPHPDRNWLALVTINNVFSLWNYEHSIILKTFNCSTLDDGKQLEIRQLLFMDKSTTRSFATNKNKQTKIKNYIVFTTQRRVYFYDYLNDALKSVSEKDLDFKNIRKTEIIGQQSICIGCTDGSLKILEIHSLNVLNTLKGYHNKPINWIIPYKQNQNEKARVIAASTDSLMACWNVESTSELPSFKFLMRKNNKILSDSNDGQQIICMKYDRTNFRIITVTEQYIAMWSTLSGIQTKRLKNINNTKEVQIFSHMNFSNQSFVSHNGGQQIFITTFDNKNISSIIPFETTGLFTMKQLINDNCKIQKMQILPEIPSILFICGTSGISVIQINKFYKESFCFRQSFTTKLSTLNSRQFFTTEGILHNAVTPYKINNMVFKSDEFYNFFYLSNQKSMIYFNLIQLKFLQMTSTRHQYKLIDLSSNLLLKQKLQINVSFDSTLISLFNRATSAFQILSLLTPKSQLIDLDEEPRIDFYARFKLQIAGICTNLIWHQYKSQFAVILPINSNNQLIKFKQSKTIQFDSKINSYSLFIYSKINQKFEVIYRKDNVQSDIYKLFSGPYYGYSIKNYQRTEEEKKSETNKFEKIQFIFTQENKIKVIPASIFVPQKIYWSYCGTLAIMSYQTEFIIYRVQPKGALIYVKSIQQIVLNGYFWEKLFFYITHQGLYFLQIYNQKLINLQIADRNPRHFVHHFQCQIFDPDFIDDLDSKIVELPSGQLQILTIVNLYVCLISSQAQMFWIKLQNPYIIFCLQVISGTLQNSKKYYKNVDYRIKHIFDQTIKYYGYQQSDFL